MCSHLNSFKDIVVSGIHTELNEYDKIAQILRIDIVIIIGYNHKYVHSLLNKINQYEDPKKVLLILPERMVKNQRAILTNHYLQLLTCDQRIEKVEDSIIKLTKADQKLRKRSNLELISSITSREKEILQLIKKGKKTKEIAHELFLSAKTVENHRNNILKKTNSKSMLSLINELYKLGILEL